MKILLLGGFEVRLPDGRPLALPTRKAEALLAVLAAQPGTAHPRERLATLLWSGSADAQARGSLRQTLALLRKALEADGATAVVAQGESLSLDPAGLQVDTAAFDAAVANGTPERLAEAVALCRGPFLDGFALAEEPFEEWLAQERTRRHQRAVEACERLLAHHAEAGEVAAGLALGERLLALEPTSEAAVRGLMRLHGRKGARSAVARQYERCRQTLAAELGVDPSPETAALYRELLAPVVPPAAEGGAGGPPAVAVLPFETPPDDAEQAWLADGLAADIIRELSRFRSFAVIARHSAFALRDLKLTAREMGERLGARYLLSGTLRRSGGSVRIAMELADAASGRQLWAERYDFAGDRILTAQDEIARAVVGTLALRIDGTMLQQARRKALEDLQAYDCWLRGLDYVRKGPDKLEEARGFFRRALAIDPHYARAHCGLSLSYFNEWNCSNWSIWAEREESAFESARRAVELDDTDHLAQLILGRIYLYRRDYARAEQHLARAEALNPNDADLLVHLALGHSYLGDPERARRLAELAVRLNPLHDSWYYIFIMPGALVQRRFADVVAMGERSLEVAVKVPAFVAAAHAHLGALDEARRHVEAFLSLFQRRITYGRPPTPGEAIDWLKRINVFRRPEDLAPLIEGLARAGLAEGGAGRAAPRRLRSVAEA